MLREKVGEKTEFVGVGGRNGGNREDGNICIMQRRGKDVEGYFKRAKRETLGRKNLRCDVKEMKKVGSKRVRERKKKGRRLLYSEKA